MTNTITMNAGTSEAFNFGTLWQPAVRGLADMGIRVDNIALCHAAQAEETRIALQNETLNADCSSTCLLAFAANAWQGDETLHAHSERVAVCSVRLGRSIGLSSRELETLHFAALLHDCGKLALDPDVLTKPGALDDGEFAHIKTHPRCGECLLETLPFLKEALPGVRFHHERWDGAGYPDGLGGEDIPLAARIIGLCDAFDAMTHRRPYHDALSTSEARGVIRRESGSHFDPALVSAFLAKPTRARRFVFLSRHISRGVGAFV
ncbi:MAG TPA: HD-GYP domain-containing protein [Abditibacteriaceae bacterium]|jgi:HD-GYP domain-containing protein (c-di-GMP phosphodiesterase class II)